MRRWLKEEGKWKEWQNLEVKWVNGHNPDLIVLKENGQENERIDLTEYSYVQIDEMLRSKGFKKQGEY